MLPVPSVDRHRGQLADLSLCLVSADLVDAVAPACAAGQAVGPLPALRPKRKQPLLHAAARRERWQGKQALLAAFDEAAAADRSNKLGGLRWLEAQD